MRIRKVFLIILILPLLLNFVYAGSISFESYIETVEIESKTNVHETINAIVNINGSRESISFPLIPMISNLEVFFDDVRINCEIVEQVEFSNVSCFFHKLTSGKHSLKVEFDSYYPLISLDKRLMFRSGYDPIISTKNFVFVLKLPLGYIIPKEAGKDETFFVNPEPDNLYSDGQRIILNWKDESLEKKFEASVILEKLEDSPKILEIILFLVLIGVILFLFLNFKRKIKQEKKKIAKKRLTTKKKSKTEILEEHLMENEKKVINELRNADKKELWQKQLQLKTEFSKAKLSRIIRNLEARNIIQKIPFGNTNKIKLKIS